MIQAISIMPISLKIKVNFKIIWTCLVLIFFSLSIVSVYQFNIYTSEIYFISQIEKEINQLSQENKILEISLAEANSLGNLGNYAQNFERTESIEYLRVLEGTALAK